MHRPRAPGNDSGLEPIRYSRIAYGAWCSSLKISSYAYGWLSPTTLWSGEVVAKIEAKDGTRIS